MFLFLKYFILYCLCVLYAYAHTCVWQRGPEEGVRTPTTGAGLIRQWWADRCRCWESNSGPRQEQQVFLTTEPSLCSPVLHTHIYLYEWSVSQLLCSQFAPLHALLGQLYPQQALLSLVRYIMLSVSDLLAFTELGSTCRNKHTYLWQPCTFDNRCE